MAELLLGQVVDYFLFLLISFGIFCCYVERDVHSPTLTGNFFAAIISWGERGRSISGDH